MSKRKAEYGRTDRATCKRKNRKEKAAQSRWESVPRQSASLTDVINTSTQTGSRIIDLDNLSTGLNEISRHSAQCGGMCVLEGETMHAGLATVLSVKCIKCESNFRIESSKRVKTADGHQRWVVMMLQCQGRCQRVEAQHRSHAQWHQ